MSEKTPTNIFFYFWLKNTSLSGKNWKKKHEKTWDKTSSGEMTFGEMTFGEMTISGTRKACNMFFWLIEMRKVGQGGIELEIS